MKLINKKFYRIITTVLVGCILFNSFPTNAASKMSGLDFSMQKNSEFYIDCYTPAGMKSKRMIMTKYQKKKVTASKILDQDDPEAILRFYDDYYGIYYFDEMEDYDEDFEDDYDYDYSNDYDLDDEDDVNKLYKSAFKKLEIVTIRIKYSRRWEPTLYDVEKCCDTSSFYNHTIHLVDYKSGKSLITSSVNQTSTAKSKGVYVVGIDWYNKGKTYFYNYYGDYIYLSDTGYADVTIIKPKKYKDLCVGVAGDSRLKLSSSDKKFYKGKVDYKKTSWYKSDSSNSKWMRVK